MSKDKPQILLDNYLRTLKLGAIRREYPLIAERCQSENSDYSTFLLKLTERELSDREQRSTERRIKSAHFRLIKTLDTFDFSAQPSINKALVCELAKGEYIDKKENVLLIGNPGTGKTHLACALGYAACTKGKKTRFYSALELVTKLLEARENRELERTLRSIEKQHVVILDEFGYIPFTKVGAELLFEVVGRAYERSSLIITTNLPFENWTDVLGNQRLTGALLDRLTHRIHIIEANGKSYRFEQAKKKKRK